METRSYSVNLMFDHHLYKQDTRNLYVNVTHDITSAHFVKWYQVLMQKIGVSSCLAFDTFENAKQSM